MLFFHALAALALSQVPLGETERLAAALAMKEERRLEPALLELETLAASGASSAIVPGRAEASPTSAGPRTTAARVLAELEAIDTRLRLGRPQGVASRLGGLSREWAGQADILRRVRALETLVHLQGASLLEPNAISRADLGDRARARFYPGRRPDDPPRIPLDLPIRHLSELSPSVPVPGARAGPRVRAVVVAGFLGIDELSAERRESWRPALEYFDFDPRALLCLFIFTGEEEPPPAAIAEEPWSRIVIFWIRGTPRKLASAPVRSRYEWLPGPTFFLVAPGGRLRSWRWPEESWRGFVADVRAELANGAGQEK